MKSKLYYPIISSLCSLFILVNHSYAQQDVTIDDIRSSTPPAFNIIDIEPKSITRPTTPRGLATSLVSSFNENGFKPDFSLEVAPYWLKRNQKITFNDYLNPVGFQGIRQTASWSIATKERRTSDSTTEGTQLGIGFRTQIIPGKPSTNSKLLLQEVQYEQLMSSLLATAKNDQTIKSKNDIRIRMRETISNVLSGKIAFGPITGWDNADLIKLLRSGEVEKEIITLIDKEEIKPGETINQFLSRLQDVNYLKNTNPLLLQESLKYRVGWILEFAAASSLAFPSNNVHEDVSFDRLGVWGNLTYRWDNQKDEVTFIARLMQGYSDSVSTNKDFGLSYSHSTKDYSISLEGIFRFYEFEFNDKNATGDVIRRIEKDKTYRIALNGIYKLSETISLTATFGKNYDNALFTSGNLLALLGVNLGLSKKQTLPVK